MRPLRDRRLVELELLYRERFPHFLQVAHAIVGDRELALEAVQEGFAGAIRGRRRFRGDGPLEAWVWQAVVNAARKQQRQPPVVSLELVLSTNGYGEEFDSGGLWQAIALLPERQRQAVFLRYYADLDYRSIAEALSVEVGTVSATLATAHARLRRMLKEVPG
jgi:RNA polymerase sigma-70 factor, ECF subfamily